VNELTGGVFGSVDPLTVMNFDRAEDSNPRTTQISAKFFVLAAHHPHLFLFTPCEYEMQGLELTKGVGIE